MRTDILNCEGANVPKKRPDMTTTLFALGDEIFLEGGNTSAAICATRKLLHVVC